MKIFGAGMAGLLAGNMLRRHNPILYEAQTSLPNNHAALLRFRTDKVSQETGIPFQKVMVTKGIKFKDRVLSIPSIPACNQYSLKVTGKAVGRSIWNLQPVERYIAPSDFITQASNSCEIYYNEETALKHHIDNCEGAAISTIPMNILMDIVKWKDKPKFEYLPIWSYQLNLGEQFDVYQTIYYAEMYESVYRASITGNVLIVEFIKDPSPLVEMLSQESFERTIRGVMADFGITHTLQSSLGLYDGVSVKNIRYQKYGKLLPIDEQARKEFILAMTDKYNIYSLGRFATWRQLLMDDVVGDVKIIEKFINERDSYKRKLSQ